MQKELLEQLLYLFCLCRFGSEETFENEKARDEAAESYHKVK